MSQDDFADNFNRCSCSRCIGCSMPSHIVGLELDAIEAAGFVDDHLCWWITVGYFMNYRFFYSSTLSFLPTIILIIYGLRRSSIVSTNSVAQPGRVKKLITFPSDMTSALLRLSSTIGPKINPRTIGAGGIPSFLMLYPINPKMIRIRMSKGLF